MRLAHLSGVGHKPGLVLLGVHARQRATQRVFADDLLHSQNLRTHRITSQASNVGVTFVPGQYAEQPCSQHIALAVRVGTGVEWLKGKLLTQDSYTPVVAMNSAKNISCAFGVALAP